MSCFVVPVSIFSGTKGGGKLGGRVVWLSWGRVVGKGGGRLGGECLSKGGGRLGGRVAHKLCGEGLGESWAKVWGN